jgi:hypothetical protein
MTLKENVAKFQNRVIRLTKRGVVTDGREKSREILSLGQFLVYMPSGFLPATLWK